ncbi:hypothetical protein [Streptomyces sp. DSM 118878]
MKSVVSRAVVAVSVVAVLGSTAACGGSGGGSGAGDGRGEGGPDGGGGGRGGGRPSASAAPSQGPGARLERAALAAGDIKGYEVEEPKASGGAAKPTAAPDPQASPAKCAPLAAPLAAVPQKPKAQVDRVVTSVDDKDHTTTDVRLSAYAAADAERVMADLREATKAKRCATFRVGGHRYFGVHPLPAPDKGDASVSYAYAHRVGEFVTRETVTVVRSGGTIATFAASNLYNPQGVQDDRQAERDGMEGGGTPTADENPKVAAVIVDAQLAKV